MPTLSTFSSPADPSHCHQHEERAWAEHGSGRHNSNNKPTSPLAAAVPGATKPVGGSSRPPRASSPPARGQRRGGEPSQPFVTPHRTDHDNNQQRGSGGRDASGTRVGSTGAESTQPFITRRTSTDHDRSGGRNASNSRPGSTGGTTGSSGRRETTQPFITHRASTDQEQRNGNSSRPGSSDPATTESSRRGETTQPFITGRNDGQSNFGQNMRTDAGEYSRRRGCGGSAASVTSSQQQQQRLADVCEPISLRRLAPCRSRLRQPVCSVVEVCCDGATNTATTSRPVLQLVLEFLRSSNGAGSSSIIAGGDHDDSVSAKCIAGGVSASAAVTRVREVMRVSCDGQIVVVGRPQRGVDDRLRADAPLSLDGCSCATFGFDDLPREYWQKYQCAVKFVGLCRSTTPKITRYTKNAKHILMENGDFQSDFSDGHKVSVVDSGRKVVTPQGAVASFEADRADSFVESLKPLLAQTDDAHAFCLKMDRVLTDVDFAEDPFPVIMGNPPAKTSRPTGPSQPNRLSSAPGSTISTQLSTQSHGDGGQQRRPSTNPSSSSQQQHNKTDQEQRKSSGCLGNRNRRLSDAPSLQPIHNTRNRDYN